MENKKMKTSLDYIEQDLKNRIKILDHEPNDVLLKTLSSLFGYND